MQQDSPDALQQAINEIYLWAKAGCPPHKCLTAVAGICSNLGWLTGYRPSAIGELFFGEDEYPFNGDWLDYGNETNKFTNPQRLAWLKTHQTVE